MLYSPNFIILVLDELDQLQFSKFFQFESLFALEFIGDVSPKPIAEPVDTESWMTTVKYLVGVASSELVPVCFTIAVALVAV